MTADLFETIKKVLVLEEGKRNKTYDDATGREVKAPLGFLSIGIGHNLQACGLSDAVIDAILEEDVLKAFDALHRHFETDWQSWGTARLVATLALIFQVGDSGFRNFHDLIAAIKAHDWTVAGAELEDSLWARQVAQRRKERTLLMLVNNEFDKDYGL